MVLRYLCGCFSEYTHFDSQALSARLTHNVLRSSRDLSAQTSATRCEPADLLGQAPVGEERSTQKSEKVLACVAGFGSSVVAWRPILMANRKGPMAMHERSGAVRRTHTPSSRLLVVIVSGYSG